MTDIPFLEYPPKRPPLIPRPVCIPTTLKIPVHFTVFTTNHSTASMVDVYTLDRQIKRTNEAFERLNITFYIASINYHIGQEWERFTHHKYEQDKDYFAYSERIKAENRHGGNDEVNIWVVESIGEVNCTNGARTMGYCTFARNLLDPNHQVDGCPIVIDSLPGIAWRGSSEGKGTTLTHEIGHWLDLEHIFPESESCSGESDSITDTYQFPGGGVKYNSQQPRCCQYPNGKWDFCEDAKQYNVTNYMSYSPQRGQWLSGNDEGAAPWTTEQRAHMFSSFFTLRRPAPKGTVNVKCSDYPLWPDQHPAQTRALFRRAAAESGPITTRDLKGPHLFRQSNYLLEHLKEICSQKPTEAMSMKGIDVISGEVLTCAEDGTCQPSKSSPPRCPDGTSPPCRVAAWCPDGSRPNPHCQPLYLCEDGSVPPCTGNGGDVRPPGEKKGSCPPGTPGPGTPGPGPGTPGPGPGPGPGTPGPGTGGGGICPAGCNPLSGQNKCDATTAPTCIYPDPRVAKPRAACACRPGYKAYKTGQEPKGELKQWRLPIPGQEHRVWVAEGVKCDELCEVSTGAGSCREVAEVDARCVGY